MQGAKKTLTWYYSDCFESSQNPKRSQCWDFS